MHEELAGSVALRVRSELERALASVRHDMLLSDLTAFEQGLYELLCEKAWFGRKETLG